MRIFGPVIVLLLLAASFHAILNYSNSGQGLDTNGWTGEQIKPVWADHPFPNYTIGSDAEAGQYDIFANGREYATSGTPRLVLGSLYACNGEDIQVQVTYAGQPFAGASVGLYSHGGGRKLVGQTTTNANGWTYFYRQPYGTYDLYATAPNVLPALRVFDAGAPCPPQADNYRTGAGSPPATGAPSADTNATAQQPAVYSLSYPGAVRTLSPIALPGGKVGTLVTIQVKSDVDIGNATLVETVPSALASGPTAIGFESDYPSSISNVTPLQLKWAVSHWPAGGSLIRSYVLLRPPQPMMTHEYASPMVMNGAGQVIFGNPTPTAPMANATARAPSNAASGFPMADAMTGGGVGAWVVPLVVGMGLGITLLFVLWIARGRKEKTDAPQAENAES